MRTSLRVFLHVFAALLVAVSVPLAALAEPDAGAADDPGASEQNADLQKQLSEREGLIAALVELRDAVAAKKAEIAESQAALEAAKDEPSRREQKEALEILYAEIADLESRFARLSTQADESLFADASDIPFDPREKLFGLLKPVFDELEEMTSNSREIARLETELGTQKAREVESIKAVENLETLSEHELDAPVRAAVDEQLETWRARVEDAEAQVKSIEFELNQRRSQQKPLASSAGEFVQGFVRTRGFNLLLAAVAFAAAFFGVRMAHRGYRRLRPLTKERRFGDRVAMLGFQGLSIGLGIAAVLFVFNVVGDWFLLGISLFALLGIGWAALKALPEFVEQIRLILNLGGVKEGELVVYDDVPWRVQSISFEAVLANDRLSGGRQVLPVRDLLDLHSRAMGDHEELFPCKEGDWVELEDETIGKVVYQTPTVVQIVLLGGIQKTYGTPAFLGLNPRNLSTNYRIEFTFGIDYRHQADCTKTIPEKMQAKLEQDMAAVLKPKQLLNVEVEFKEAAASSLDYEIQIDVHGSAAARYEDVERAAARILVDACNENGWEIPFQQVTIHSAAG